MVERADTCPPDRFSPGGRWVSVKSRAQSEPLAALLSVAAVCLAVSLYTGVLGETLPKLGEDRTVADPTADAVWQDIKTDGAFDTETDISESVVRSSLPEGYAVGIEVTTVGEDGRQTEAGRAVFDATGAVADTDPPEKTTSVERPVSVRLQSGDIRPGLLTVEVWQ